MITRNPLLQEFLSELVAVTTTINNAVMTETGDMAEIPVVLEGTLLDFDEDYLLIGGHPGESPKLISRSHVLAVEVVDQFEEVMRDPNKPPAGDMN